MSEVRVHLFNENFNTTSLTLIYPNCRLEKTLETFDVLEDTLGYNLRAVFPIHVVKYAEVLN